MASASLPLASFENGAVTVSVVYDDVSLAVSSLTYSNTSGANAPVTVVENNKTRSFTIPQGSGSWDVSKFNLTLVLNAITGELTWGFTSSITWGKP